MRALGQVGAACPSEPKPYRQILPQEYFSPLKYWEASTLSLLKSQLPVSGCALTLIVVGRFSRAKKTKAISREPTYGTGEGST